MVDSPERPLVGLLKALPISPCLCCPTQRHNSPRYPDQLLKAYPSGGELHRWVFGLEEHIYLLIGQSRSPPALRALVVIKCGHLPKSPVPECSPPDSGPKCSSALFH